MYNEISGRRRSLIARAAGRLNDRGHLTNITYSEIRERDRNTKRDRDFSPRARAVGQLEGAREDGKEITRPLPKHGCARAVGHLDIVFGFATWKYTAFVFESRDELVSSNFGKDGGFCVKKTIIA